MLCCVVSNYNADTVPSFKMLVFMRLVGYVLYIYPVVEVLPCYLKVLLCYLTSVTGNTYVLCIYTVLGDC